VNKTLAIVILFFVNANAADQNKKDLAASQDQVWVCVKWKWNSQDPFNQTAVCTEWKKKDCSAVWHKNLCQAQGRK
jgi:hypothetical protein